ncbi:MAG: hypothetical protein EXR64_00670 [Dehalococcoidia bacterium]|nr:hypothetical protein [Dehalococcoidia bacterium]
MSLVHSVWHPSVQGPLPTLVALHGHGAHGLDLMGLAPLLAAGRLLVICPEAEFALEEHGGAFTWFAREGAASRTSEEFERVTAAVRAFIDEAVPRLGGDPARVAVLGFSQGGTLAYRLALGDPARYRGLAALSTYLPEEAIEHAAPAEVVEGLPILVQHGSSDAQIAIERAQQSRDLLLIMGARPDYREYAMGHQIGTASLRDLSRWLEQIFDLPPSR